MERVAGVHGGRDGVGGLAGDLAAVGTVGLVAVVRGRVVAGGHADAARALKIARGPGQRGHRGDLGVHVRGHAVGSQDRRGSLDEQLTLVAAVARDGHGGVLEVLDQVVGEALRGAADGVDVHAVGAGAQRAAQTRSAECEVLEERIGDRALVARLLHRLQLGEKLFISDVLDPRGEKLMHISHGLTFPNPTCRAKHAQNGHVYLHHTPPRCPRAHFPVRSVDLSARGGGPSGSRRVSVCGGRPNEARVQS